MMPSAVAIVVYGLSENWLGGVNYYRNLVQVFDGAADDSLRLHVLTDEPRFFADMGLSRRVQIHQLGLLQHGSPSWALRKALLTITGRDSLLISQLKRLSAKAAVFCHVPGASAAGIHCLPWIPDFQSRHHPELFLPTVVEAERRRAQLWLRDSDGLVVSSKSARDDAVAFYGADPQRVHVLHFAPRMDAAALSDVAVRDAALARHGIARPYFFLPNQYWKHKNHGLVLQAMALLRDRGVALPLVVSTGKTEDLRDPGYYPEFEAQRLRLRLKDAYRTLGVIPRADMLVLLAHSLAVINPSRFEGWSTGVEEAKALGKALLVSDIAVHREQVADLADAGVFGTDDAATLADLMAQRQTAASAGHPAPQARPAIYEAFSHQYLQLLQHVVAAPPVTA